MTTNTNETTQTATQTQNGEATMNMYYSAEEQIVFGTAILEQDNDLTHLEVKFYDAGNGISGKLSLLVATPVDMEDVEEALIDQYSEGNYEDLDEKSTQVLQDWETDNVGFIDTEEAINLIDAFLDAEESRTMEWLVGWVKDNTQVENAEQTVLDFVEHMDKQATLEQIPEFYDKYERPDVNEQFVNDWMQQFDDNTNAIDSVQWYINNIA